MSVDPGEPLTCPTCGAELERINAITYECPKCDTEWLVTAVVLPDA